MEYSDYFDIPNDSQYLSEDVRAELIERNLVLGVDATVSNSIDYSAAFYDEDGEEVEIEGFNANDEAFDFFVSDSRVSDFVERKLNQLEMER
jgi:hypothetical protein